MEKGGGGGGGGGGEGGGGGGGGGGAGGRAQCRPQVYQLNCCHINVKYGCFRFTLS